MIASYQLSLGTSCCVFVPSLSIVKAVHVLTCLNTPNKSISTAMRLIDTENGSRSFKDLREITAVDHLRIYVR